MVKQTDSLATDARAEQLGPRDPDELVEDDESELPEDDETVEPPDDDLPPMTT